MAVWDSSIISTNRAAAGMLRGRTEMPRVDAPYAEPEVVNKWHPAATLAFIMVSCALLWGGIFAVIALIL